MRNVLLLVSSLHYHFSARQLTLLARHLPGAGINARIAVLGGAAPWVQTLREAGAVVHVLGWTRAIDARPLFALRGLVRAFRPAAIHVWDLPALRTLLLIGGPGRARLVVSRALPLGRHISWLDRLLLRQADHVLALGNHEGTRYLAAGVAGNRLVVGAPAVQAEPALLSPETPTRTTALFMPNLPPGARVLLGIGPITWAKGFRDAAWALDILNHLQDIHHLVLVGSAPDGEKLVRFTRAIEVADRVHFTGPVSDLRPSLDRAQVVWVPGWMGSGVGAALEAMTAGRPVVAARRPPLIEVIADEETGLLVPAHDKAALARQTLRLLKDPELALAMGEAGRRRAAKVFFPEQLVERCLALYD